MKFVSISILTTGLDPIKNDILEISAIVENTKNPKPLDKLPVFRIWIDKEFYRGNPYALAANASVLEQIGKLRIKNSKRLVAPDEVWGKLVDFLRPDFSTNNKFEHKIPIAGKSYATFDRLFLRRLKNFVNIPFCDRVIEPTNLFIDWGKDSLPPTLNQCLNRVGIQPDTGKGSLSVAWNTIQLLRSTYAGNKHNNNIVIDVEPIAEVVDPEDVVVQSEPENELESDVPTIDESCD